MYMDVRFRQRIAYRQARNTLLVAFLLGFILSISQITYDLLKEQKQVDATVAMVMGMLQDSALKAVYEVDKPLAERVVSGLLEYPPICEAQVSDELDAALAYKARPTVTVHLQWLANLLFDKAKDYTLPLVHDPKHQLLGHIRVSVDRYLIAQDFFKKAGLILASDLIRNIILSGVLTLLFYVSLTRPLLKMVKTLAVIDIAHPAGTLLEFSRRHDQDELGLLVRTTNMVLAGFGETLAKHQATQQELRTHHDHLEELVKERTAKIESQNGQLRQEKENVQRYLDIAGVIFLVIDAEQRVSLINRKGCEVLGYSEQEILGQNWFEYFLPERERERVLHAFVQWMKGNNEPMKYFENPVMTRQAEERLIAWHNALLRDEHGTPLAVLSSGEDITDRKRAEEALRESQRQLQESYQREQERRQLSDTLREVAAIVSGTLEQHKVVVLILDQLKKVVTYHYANLLLLQGDQLTRIMRRNLMGDLFEPLTVPADLYTLNAAALHDKRPVVVSDVRNDEHWQPSKETAEIRSFLVTPLLVQDRPIGVLCVGRNDDIPYTEDDAQTVFAFATQVAIALENARLVEQTQRTLHELEKTLDDLRKTQTQLIESEKMAALGQLVAGIAHEINTPLGAIQASATNIVDALSESLTLLPQLFTQLSAERQTEFLKLTAHALRPKAMLTSREERQYKYALQQELASYHLDHADDIASMIVDIGIYQGIGDFVPLLRETNYKMMLHAVYDLAAQQTNCQNILTAISRVSKIVFALKNYAHFDHSDQKTKARISDGIEVVLTLYQNQFKQGIDVVRHYEDVPLIACYQDELHQVWTNLIHNAIYAMNGKGTLEITVYPTPSLPNWRGNEGGVGEGWGGVVVQITDSGCGIPPEVQSHIFEPFFTTKPTGEGSGLGLDICRKIIEKHQGQITFESQPGRTTFRVFLPI
jgi:PAS domain S-box-containing protein